MKTIVIFVKAPRPGRVKTRLAAGLGAKKAALLYKALAINTLSAARAVPDAKVFVAYDGSNPAWLSKRSPAWFKQVGDNLGVRLTHAADHLFHQGARSVILIGSDLPALTPKLLTQAFRALERVPVVIGPSCDGGYYLIGLRSPQPSLFRNIRWSTPRVFPQTIAAVKKSKLRFRLLPVQRDLDTLEDLKALLAC